ncbi:MAG: sensor histidine kinase [Caulobacterales bacterium 32-69-10]|nr:MAG: sensor histidine kinase [Caulobacterales bacterium 32-69-10]
MSVPGLRLGELRLGELGRGVLGRPSITRRLILLALGWSLMLLIVTGVALSLFFHQASLSRFDQSLGDTAEALYAGSTVEDGQPVAPPLTDARALRAYSGKYWQIGEFTADGKLRAVSRSRSLWDSVMQAPPDLAARLRRSPGEPVRYDAVGPAMEPIRALAMMGQLPGRTEPVVFMAAEDRRIIDRDVRRFALTTSVTLALLGAGLAAAVFLQVRVGLGPLFAMGREVAAVRQGKAQRLSTTYPAELDPLAGELNALLDHNQEVVERQRTHVGNLAHALKTPISVMLAEAEQQPGALAGVVTRQAQAMRDHVEHHLRRARAAARTTGVGERTSVAEVLDELTRTLERIYRGKVQVEWDAPDELNFAGERQDLQEMAGNIMENACKWARGRVRATTAEGTDPRRFLLVVEDDGPGLPPDQHAAVLRRGERLDENAPGSGLGLSIVDELARAYGGDLNLSDSVLGGLKIALSLPRAEV